LPYTRLFRSERPGPTRGEGEHLQAGVAPTGALWGEVQLQRAGGQGAVRVEHARHAGLRESRLTAASTAAATSPSGGYSIARPITRPRAFSHASARRQRVSAASGSCGTAPPSSRQGSVVAASTRSMSSAAGSLNQGRAEARPRPEATAVEWITASGLGLLR